MLRAVAFCACAYVKFKSSGTVYRIFSFLIHKFSPIPHVWPRGHQILKWYMDFEIFARFQIIYKISPAKLAFYFYGQYALIYSTTYYECLCIWKAYELENISTYRIYLGPWKAIRNLTSFIV